MSSGSNFNGGGGGGGGGVVDTPFPVCGLVPKGETGVLNFLQKYPEFNGKDVTIAIFDSGVDPRATGLETLCDGRTVKVIERFDCSGSGDVDMTKKVTADAKGIITGLSGRQLKLTPYMLANNVAPNKEFRIGLKNFFDLCPPKVREKVINAAKHKEWDGPHKMAIADALRKINEFEAQNSDTSKLTWDKKLIKDDLDNTLELLSNYEKFYNDIKTTYDCILYQTADCWEAAIDISEEGNLETAVIIGEYSKTHAVQNIDDYFSISINVHDAGNVLEVVGMCSSHGTHVASIASGNHGLPGCDSAVNGVAPNAKIVSMTIGDGRLGSMETGTGLVRAMMKVMELCRTGRQIDVINMSYGEHAHWTTAGRIGQLMSEVVNKYGVVWVASAGNHGPALCTVGTPPDISQPSCIGVGAYVSPQMMEAEYAMREKLPGNCYTWTSRDPCIDGGQGVSVCAPGGAIASVPQFTMSKSQLMNGTSMAAPHVAGAIALLISGLKQKGISYSPFSIKRAICATATKLSYVDNFAQGSGLLNVDKAFEHLVEHAEAAENLLRFSVRCGPQNAKGIHLREGVLRKPTEYNVNIEPVFINEKEAAPADKFNYNVRLNLVSSQPFVQCGAHLDLCYGTRSIAVNVDPRGLPPGVHTAVVRAFDSANVQKGSLFEIPVTLVQPHVVNCEETRTFTCSTGGGSGGGIEFQPNTIQRDFILVPKQATWAVLRMRSTDKNRDKDAGKYFVHTMQILPKSSCRTMEVQKILSVGEENDSTLVFKCRENNILELCIAKYWSNYGSTHLKYSLEFHGVQAISPNACTMHVARGIHRFDVAALVTEEIQPQLQLKTGAVVLRPNETKISPLSSTRDVIPDGRQIYQNLLTYTLNVPKAQEVALYAPLFNAVLYEAEYESQLWMLFDSNKSMIASGDANSHTFTRKLEKGEYTVRLQVRHEKRDALEKIGEATMVALYKLSNPISLDVYDHYNQCIIGGRKFTSCVLKEGGVQNKVLYVGPLPQEKLVKASLPPNCAWLAGSLSLAKDEAAKRVEAVDFMYILNPADAAKKNGAANGGAAAAATTPAADNNTNQTAKAKASATTTTTTTATNTSMAAANPNAIVGGPSPAPSTAGDVGAAVAATGGASGSPKKGKASADDYAEALRDFHCVMITKCELEKAEKIYEEVVAAHPKLVLPHLLLIHNIESTELKSQFPLTFVKAQQQQASSPAGEATPTAGDQEGGSEQKSKEDSPTPGAGAVSAQKMRTILQRIIQLANIVIKETEHDALLAYYGLKCDTRADAAKIKTNMDKQKNNLLDALVRKGIALAKLQVLADGGGAQSPVASNATHLEELDGIFTEIVKFVEGNDPKVIQFSLWHAYAHGQFGRMYKYLQKMYEEKRQRENFEEVYLIAGALQHAHLQRVVQRMTVSAYPQGYRMF